jgi:hypothetical protein
MSEERDRMTVEETQREHIAYLRGLLASKQAWYEEALAQERKERLEAQGREKEAYDEADKLRAALAVCWQVATDSSNQDLSHIRPLLGLDA